MTIGPPALRKTEAALARWRRIELGLTSNSLAEERPKPRSGSPPTSKKFHGRSRRRGDRVRRRQA
jgi:hypothetical protein